VTPLMDLVCEHNPEAQKSNKGSKEQIIEVIGTDGNEGSQYKERNGKHTVVAISFNEVVMSDGKRFEVMLAERSNKSLSHKRSV